MRPYLRKKLEELNIKTSRYIVSYDGVVYDYDTPNVLVQIWGLALEHDEHGTLYVEYQTDEYGGNPRYCLRTKQGDPDSSVMLRVRQSDAIGDALTRWSVGIGV